MPVRFYDMSREQRLRQRTLMRERIEAERAERTPEVHAQEDAEREHAWERFRERQRRLDAERDAAPNPEVFERERIIARHLGGSTTQVIYGLVDPIDDRIRYIGRSGRVQRRYRDHVKSMDRPIPSGSMLLDDDTLEPIGPYACCADADAAGEPHTFRYWLHDLYEEGLKPVLRILEEVKPPRLVFERELRWIFHAVCTGIPILNDEVINELGGQSMYQHLGAIRAVGVEWLTVPLEDDRVHMLLSSGILSYPNGGIPRGDWHWLMYARTGDIQFLRPPHMLRHRWMGNNGPTN